jgi:hypothetical protein
MGRRTQIVLAVIGAVSLLVGVLAHFIETDEEAIERITEECRDAFLDGDADAIVAHLDAEATGNVRIDRGPLAELARRVVASHGERVRRIEFVRREIQVEGDEAQGRWLAWVTLNRGSRRHGPPGGVFKVQAMIDFRRGPDDRWRIWKVDVGAP